MSNQEILVHRHLDADSQVMTKSLQDLNAALAEWGAEDWEARPGWAGHADLYLGEANDPAYSIAPGGGIVRDSNADKGFRVLDPDDPELEETQ